jgi:hypothetical protein
MNNVHTQNIPDEVLAEVMTKLGEIAIILKPYLLTLTATERGDLPKMGDKSIAFVQKSHEFSKINPEFAPKYLNLLDFDIDFNDSQNLIPVLNSFTQLVNGIDDTKLAAGSEAYQAALLYYNGVQRAVEANVPGAKAIFDELKNRFPAQVKKQKAPAV